MTLFNRILGDAVAVDPKKVEKKLASILLDEEKILFALKVIRDKTVFTDKRIIIVDYSGITGKRVKFKIIPYRSIDYFTVTTAGHVDIDFELHLHIKGRDDPIVVDIKKDRELVDDLIKLLSALIVVG